MRMFYEKLPEDMRKVIVKCAVQYITKAIGNRTVSGKEWDMISTILPDMSPDMLQAFVTVNQNVSFFYRLSTLTY
jgi:hypothetical protein